MSRRREWMVFSPISKKWEFGTKEWNAEKSLFQWERRDGSWICMDGDEVALAHVPAKPLLA